MQESDLKWFETAKVYLSLLFLNVMFIKKLTSNALINCVWKSAFHCHPHFVMSVFRKRKRNRKRKRKRNCKNYKLLKMKRSRKRNRKQKDGLIWLVAYLFYWFSLFLQNFVTWSNLIKFDQIWSKPWSWSNLIKCDGIAFL